MANKRTIGELGASMAQECVDGHHRDDDGTPLLPPSPLPSHWERLRAAVGRPLGWEEEDAFRDAFQLTVMHAVVMRSFDV